MKEEDKEFLINNCKFEQQFSRGHLRETILNTVWMGIVVVKDGTFEGVEKKAGQIITEVSDQGIGAWVEKDELYLPEGLEVDAKGNIVRMES
tara:strand:+ start:487 stop:762 length:276 start_codon:yes stop_codon:yes gene_type:complete